MSASAVDPVNPVVFDDGPGRTRPTPTTLGPYEMTAYPDDPTKRDVSTSVIPAPGGDQLTLSVPMTLDRGDMLSGGWGGTTGEDVYADWDGEHRNVTLTLPSGVNAISFYAMTTTCGFHQDITATTDSGTSSGLTSVGQKCGTPNQPPYFGFYTTDGSAITSLTLHDSEGFGLIFGELAQHREPPTPVVHERSLTLGFAHRKAKDTTRLDLSGDLSVVGDVDACTANQRVVVKRYTSSTMQWTRLGSTVTDSAGHFSYTTVDKKRRYMAVVRAHSLPEYDVTNGCAATQVTRRHAH